MKIYSVTMLCTSTEYATCVGLCRTREDAEDLMKKTAEAMKLGELYLHEKGVWSDLDWDRDFDSDFRETIFRIEEQTLAGVAVSPVKTLSVVLDVDYYLQAFEGVSDSLSPDEKKDLLSSKYYKLVGKTRHIVKCAVDNDVEFVKLELIGDITPTDLASFVTDGVASDNTLWKAFALAMIDKYEC